MASCEIGSKIAFKDPSSPFFTRGSLPPEIWPGKVPQEIPVFDINLQTGPFRWLVTRELSACGSFKGIFSPHFFIVPVNLSSGSVLPQDSPLLFQGASETF